MFTVFQVNKINFEQYLKLHKHPDPFIQTCDAMIQMDHTTIRRKPIFENASNRMRTTLFEAIIHQQIPIATAHHQLSGPITHVMP